jgi:hypothetical protein
MKTRCSRREMLGGIIVSSLVGATAVTSHQPGPARADTDADKVIRLTPDELAWTSGPPMLPPRARMAVIEGSFSHPGPFTIR